ncbi:amyloid fiber anchoring/assembly protein TapA [Neobacillus sedimentimangrovi]|uniref:Amyloid fiber anchoring/assembly protein TapA n=1 Tax=Neobacillus sedimentimangrovi TaxID=2699460 RepID=A0ABS8QM05_9BACI|nr:amyloid fiber anchoring/assembly protein TapA [Neobacillus sedimentimangrovi]MCD4840285.1 amyloid fiber anchoring/assembly protein TapA [Neobacillus sedimentimangrovi]
MRSKRVRKFRSRARKILIAGQLVSIWYVLILTGAYLTSTTGAAFNDIEVIKNSLHANWDTDNNDWDKSSLDFDGTKAWAEGNTVYTTVKNAGDRANSTSTWRYFLYKVVDGKPVGNPVATGVVPIIQSGKMGTISATVTENGNYRFTIRRPLGHPAKNNPDANGHTYIGWSQLITVNIVDNLPPSEDTTIPDNSNDPKPQPETKQPIGEITDIKWNIKGQSGQVTITWKNPTSPEFSHLKIYKEGNMISPEFKDQKLELGKDDTKTKVTYRITTVDKNGNESAGISLTVSKTNVKVN